jgi:hypothetical protein
MDELVSLLEEKKHEKRQGIGKTRTKEASTELKGEMLGIDEALFYIREYHKTQKEIDQGKHNPDPEREAEEGPASMEDTSATVSAGGRKRT